jgi:hypothetical protein
MPKGSYHRLTRKLPIFFVENWVKTLKILTNNIVSGKRVSVNSNENFSTARLSAAIFVEDASL